MELPTSFPRYRSYLTTEPLRTGARTLELEIHTIRSPLPVALSLQSSPYSLDVVFDCARPLVLGFDTHNVFVESSKRALDSIIVSCSLLTFAEITKLVVY